MNEDIKQSLNQEKKVRVSILIRAKNEERYIGKVLDVLFSQSYADFEVILVDSGSTDNTIEIAGKYPVKIHEIKPEEFTWGYSLNFGFQRSKGEYVVCLSAHSLPLSEDWLETLISNFDDDNVAAVMCNTLPWPDCNPFDRRGLLKKFNMPKQEISDNSCFIFGNVASAIRKSLWEKVHFDETLSYCEDEDWMRKVKKLNYKVIYEPMAKVYHSHNETLIKIYRRTFQFAFAAQELKLQKFTLLNILFDLIVGSAYDMAYVLIKRDNLKWFFFAPLRRLAINLAKYNAMAK
jgi:glycosyltransferase involved in cell wall biosynthesis